MTETRPDLAHAVSEVSQVAANPGVIHLEAIKRTLRYVNGTRDLSLVFHGDSTKPLEGYVDADWGGDLSTRRSTTGYAFFVYGYLVSCSTKKQPTVSLSLVSRNTLPLPKQQNNSCFYADLLKKSHSHHLTTNLPLFCIQIIKAQSS